MSILNSLKTELKSSVEKVVKTLVAATKKATTETALTNMVIAAVGALRGLGMQEEIRQLGLVILCHFGGKGEQVPAPIAAIFDATTTPTTASTKFAAPTPIRTDTFAPASTPVKTSVAPGTILSAPKALPADKPAQVLTGEAPATAPKPKFVPPSGEFAKKLNGAAVKLGFEDKSVIARFRAAMKDAAGKGKEFWNSCRQLLAEVLEQNLLEAADWELVAQKMCHHLFFNGKVGEMFLRQCPKEVLINLATSQEIRAIVVGFRSQESFNPASVHQIGFVMDLCVAVGKEGAPLLTECKHSVNNLKQRRFIVADHWLVAKVAELKQPKRPAPVRGVQQSAPVSDESPDAAAVDHKLDKLQQVAESMTAPEVPATATTPEPATESTPAEADLNANGGKPPIDPEYEAEFKALMLAEEAAAKTADQPVEELASSAAA